MMGRRPFRRTVERRDFLKAIGALGMAGSLAGCVTVTPRGVFRLHGFGLAEREESVAAYIEVENVSGRKRKFTGFLAVFHENGARVSDWNYVGWQSDDVQPGERVREYVTFEAGDSGWADTNDVAQVVDAHEVRYRRAQDTTTPIGPEYTEGDIGELIA